MKLVIAEKPSVAQSIARVIGAASRRDGNLMTNVTRNICGWIDCVCFR